jgi:hypothetical protein
MNKWAIVAADRGFWYNSRRSAGFVLADSGTVYLTLSAMSAAEASRRQHRFLEEA